MNFEDILTIINDSTKTPFQRAADLHAKLELARSDSGKPVQVKKARKVRTAKSNGSTQLYDPVSGSQAVEENGEAH